MHFVLTRMPGGSYSRRFRSLLCPFYNVCRALSVLLFHILANFVHKYVWAFLCAFLSSSSVEKLFFFFLYFVKYRQSCVAHNYVHI